MPRQRLQFDVLAGFALTFEKEFEAFFERWREIRCSGWWLAARVDDACRGGCASFILGATCGDKGVV